MCVIEPYISLLEMYSTHNEGKSVVAERFIRTLKNKIYKYMASISKNVYIDKLGDIFNKYNNTYHKTIKINPVDLKSKTQVKSSKGIDDKDPEFKIGDIVRIKISRYKNIFAKGYVANWSEEVLLLQKLKILLRGRMLLVILKVKKVMERFMKKNCKYKIKMYLD